MRWAGRGSVKYIAVREKIDVRHHYVMDMKNSQEAVLTHMSTRESKAHLSRSLLGPGAFNEAINSFQGIIYQAHISCVWEYRDKWLKCNRLSVSAVSTR